MDKRQDAIALYNSGLSMNATGKHVGVSGQTVERWLVSSGVTVRNRRPTYPDHMRNEAVSLYVHEGISAASVAKKLGLKAFTVKEWLTAGGVIRSMSEAAALSISSGHCRARTSSSLWHKSTKTGEGNFAESSLEFLRMDMLDADDSVSHWSRCPHRIKYIDPDGKERRYVPDLIVVSSSGLTTIEEVKPEGRVDEPINQAKFAACRVFCEKRGWVFSIVTEIDVGYARSMAPSVLTKEEKRKRDNEKRRQRWAAESPEARADRLKHNADYMREFNRRKRNLPVASFSESGTNIPTGYIRMRKAA